MYDRKISVAAIHAYANRAEEALEREDWDGYLDELHCVLRSVHTALVFHKSEPLPEKKDAPI